MLPADPRHVDIAKLEDALGLLRDAKARRQLRQPGAADRALIRFEEIAQGADERSRPAVIGFFFDYLLNWLWAACAKPAHLGQRGPGLPAPHDPALLGLRQ